MKERITALSIVMLIITIGTAIGITSGDPKSQPGITDFKIVPNSSINDSAILSANVTNATDGSLNLVEFGIVDNNSLLGNNGQILVVFRNFSRVNGIYSNEWKANYNLITNDSISDNISVINESDIPGYLITLGLFRQNSTSNTKVALLWFNDTTLNLSKITNLSAIPLNIEDGNSTFNAAIFTFNQSGFMDAKTTSGKLFSLYNITGNSRGKNPHLLQQKVPEGRLMAYVSAYGNNLSLTMKTADIDTIPSNPVISDFKVKPNSSINQSNPALLSANITDKGKDVTMVEFAIVDNHSLIDNNNSIIAFDRNFAGVEGLYTYEWKAQYTVMNGANIGNIAISTTVSARTGTDIDSSDPGSLIVKGQFKRNNSANGTDTFAFFNISTKNLTKIMPTVTIEDGNSTFQPYLLKYINGLNDTPKDVPTGKMFAIYNLTGPRNKSNPNLMMKTVPDGRYVANVNAIDKKNKTAFNWSDIDTIPIRKYNISGFKINDTNGNGIWDSGENGISNWNITLNCFSCNSSNVTSITDNNGSYKFTGLINGTYNVTEETKPGFNATSTILKQVTINGENINNLNFTNQPVTTTPVVGISGFVINDKNGNGVQDPGETGLSGVKIRLMGIVKGRIDNKDTVTDSKGMYKFDNLEPGRYQIAETRPARFEPSTGLIVKTITLGKGENSVNNNFYLKPRN